MPYSVLDALRDAIDSHDPQRVAACFTSEFQQERPLRPQEAFVGSTRVHENWTKIFSALPDIRAEVLRRAQNGDEVWSEWEMRATNPGGASVLLRGPVILTCRDGLIDWARFYLDPVSHDGDTSITVTEVVPAPADQVFAVLCDPARHRELDAVPHDETDDHATEDRVVVLEHGRAVVRAPTAGGRRPLGQRFVWRLTPVDDEHTEVTQTYDWSEVTHAPAMAHLPARSAGELADSIRRLGRTLTRS